MPKIATMEMGTRFGYWTVIAPTKEKTSEGKAKWICECVCGTVRAVPNAGLRGNKSTSCGCRRSDNSGRPKKFVRGRDIVFSKKSTPIVKPVLTPITLSALCEGLPMRPFKPLKNYATGIGRFASMCEATR